MFNFDAYDLDDYEKNLISHALYYYRCSRSNILTTKELKKLRKLIDLLEGEIYISVRTTGCEVQDD